MSVRMANIAGQMPLAVENRIKEMIISLVLLHSQGLNELSEEVEAYCLKRIPTLIYSLQRCQHSKNAMSRSMSMLTAKYATPMA
jgi:hypothetical protein